jgi:hypothetical protein
MKKGLQQMTNIEMTNECQLATLVKPLKGQGGLCSLCSCRMLSLWVGAEPRWVLSER